MASAAVLKGLKARAEQADAMISQLKHQIQVLQAATGNSRMFIPLALCGVWRV